MKKQQLKIYTLAWYETDIEEMLATHGLLRVLLFTIKTWWNRDKW